MCYNLNTKSSFNSLYHDLSKLDHNDLKDNILLYTFVESYKQYVGAKFKNCDCPIFLLC